MPQTMANLDALPNELLARIILFSDRKALAHLRLTNKRLEGLAVGKLFERATLYADWEKPDDFEEYRYVKQERVEQQPAEQNRRVNYDEMDGFVAASDDEDDEDSDTGSFDDGDRSGSESEQPWWADIGLPGPPGYDANKFKNILESERLKKYVKEVQVYTCETHCDHHPETGCKLLFDDDRWPEPAFDGVYNDCVKRLDEFPNLSGVTVHFDRHYGGEVDDDVFQRGNFQSEFLARILYFHHRVLSNLAVRHLQNPPPPYWTRGQEVLLSKIPKAVSLRLSVVHEETDPDGDPTYRLGDMHKFWSDFPTRFLQPASSNLKTLVLYSDIPLGWFPKLDLRGVHLSNLASLTLGHHIFFHPHQIDWLISHAATLRELNLDHCAILYQSGSSIPSWLDPTGYPLAQPPGPTTTPYGISLPPSDFDTRAEFEASLHITSFPLRWHTVFRRLCTALPHLRTFRFGTAPTWNFATRTRHFLSGGTTHMTIMPWEDEQNIESRVFAERYVIWDDWENEYRVGWEREKGRRGDGGAWPCGRDLDRFEGYPECGEEDGEALRVLLGVVRGRG